MTTEEQKPTAAQAFNSIYSLLEQMSEKIGLPMQTVRQADALAQIVREALNVSSEADTAEVITSNTKTV